jgi:hypothetical protein
LMQFRQDLGHVGRQHRLLVCLGFAAGRHECVFSRCVVKEGCAGRLEGWRTA